jgi:hypothetical protein
MIVVRIKPLKKRVNADWRIDILPTKGREGEYYSY